MSKSLRNLAIVALAVAGLAAASSAKADPTEILNMTFDSGATFSGIVTFAPDYSSVEAVTGTLTDYQYGTYGYAGSGSDSIDWVWYPGTNYATAAAAAADVFSTYLMDGTGYADYYNWIDFTYDYTTAPTLVFDNNSSDLFYSYYVPNAVNGDTDWVDPMVSGSIGSTFYPPYPF